MGSTAKPVTTRRTRSRFCAATGARQQRPQIEPAALGAHRRPQITDPRKPFAHIVEPEMIEFDSALHFFPRYRRRHGRQRPRAHRIDRRQRLSPGILVVVDENPPSGAFGDPIFGGDDLGKEPLERLRQGFGERPDFFLQRAAHDRDVHVHAGRSRRLDHRRHAQTKQRVAHPQRRFAHHRERRSFDGIEVEVQIVGPVRVVAARVPLVEVDAAQVDRPQQSGGVVDDRKIDHTARAMFDRTAAQPRRAARRRTLHVEVIAADPIGIALEHHRAAGQIGHDERRDVRVVLEQIALGETALGKKRLVEVGQRYDAAGRGFDGRRRTIVRNG
jgi:hypothetical protein